MHVRAKCICLLRFSLEWLSFFFLFFFFIYMKIFKQEGWKKASHTCHLRRWWIITKKNPDNFQCTVHFSLSLTPVACEYIHNCTGQINSQEISFLPENYFPLPKHQSSNKGVIITKYQYPFPLQWVLHHQALLWCSDLLAARTGLFTGSQIPIL